MVITVAQTNPPVQRQVMITWAAKRADGMQPDAVLEVAYGVLDLGVAAMIVTRLLDAGAEIVAGLNMEWTSPSPAPLADGDRGDTSAQGAILNPHCLNPEHLAGGSSGGSAAALYYDYIDITVGGPTSATRDDPSAFPPPGVGWWG